MFQEIADRPETDFNVQVSYMEIYNERIFDLLSPDGLGDGQELAIVESKMQGVMVRGLKMLDVGSEEEALNALFLGEINRTTAEHNLNKCSNRSHCIFTVYVSQQSRLGSAEKVLFSKLHLVDLAGSERLKKTMRDDEGMDDALKKESMYINKSLTYLEQCVIALTTKARSHIPYRQTKLTNVLKDALGGNSNTGMIACVWGEQKHLEETISTLKLAQRMMRVQNTASLNVATDPTQLIKKYEKEIKELKQELRLQAALADRSAGAFEEYTPEQKVAIGDEVRKYLNASAEEEAEHEIEIDSVQKIHEVMRQVKILFRNLETATEERIQAEFTLTSKGGSGAGGNTAGGGGGGGGGAGGDAGSEAGGEFQGDVDDAEGFGMGLAAADARPQTVAAARPGLSPVHARSRARTARSPSGGLNASTTSDSKWDEAGDGEEVPHNRSEAYRMFRTRPGLGLHLEKAVQKAKAGLRQAKAAAKEAAISVNAAKDAIDELKAALDDKRASKPSAAAAGAGDVAEAGEVIVDEEEFRLMKDLADQKKAYKTTFGSLRASKAEVAEHSERADQAKKALLAAFQEWYAEATGEDVLPDEAMYGGDGVLAVEPPKMTDAEGQLLDDGEAFEMMERDKVVQDVRIRTGGGLGAWVIEGMGRHATGRVWVG